MKNLGKYFKFIAFSLFPLFVLLFLGESACRIKYYYSHDRDLNWLLGPFFKFGQTQAFDHGMYMPAVDRQGLEETPAASSAPIKVEIIRPCRDQMVYSPCREEEIPRTYNDFCWRGRQFDTNKPENSYRILVVGGSTVECQRIGDEDLWTVHLEKQLNASLGLQGILEVLNAGHSGYDSEKIYLMLQKKGYLVDPDMVIYYEAMNEQNIALEWFKIQERINLLATSSLGWLHRKLYFKSMLYTYLVEKYHYMNRKPNLWRFDEDRTRSNFGNILQDCLQKGIEFVYVMQVLDFPLKKNGSDYTNEITLRRLLDGLYSTGTEEQRDWARIRALNQRLINIIQEKMTRKQGRRVINPLPVFENVRKEEVKLFRDICHLTCYGNHLLAEIIAENLKKIITEKKMVTTAF